MNQTQDLPTREKILQVSIDLFAQKGFRDVSVRDIAKDVGIKASSLYKHYENKDDILKSIFSLFREKIAQTALPKETLRQYVKNVSPEQYLRESFAMFMQVMWAPLTVKMAKIITIEQQRSHSVRQFFKEELIEKPVQTLRYVFDLMVENGAIDPVDTEALAEEYSSYIICLYFEQNFLNESLSLNEIEKKMKQHNNFYAQYILKKKGEQIK